MRWFFRVIHFTFERFSAIFVSDVLRLNCHSTFVNNFYAKLLSTVLQNKQEFVNCMPNLIKNSVKGQGNLPTFIHVSGLNVSFLQIDVFKMKAMSTSFNVCRVHRALIAT